MKRKEGGATASTKEKHQEITLKRKSDRMQLRKQLRTREKQQQGEIEKMERLTSQEATARSNLRADHLHTQYNETSERQRDREKDSRQTGWGSAKEEKKETHKTQTHRNTHGHADTQRATIKDENESTE